MPPGVSGVPRSPASPSGAVEAPIASTCSYDPAVRLLMIEDDAQLGGVLAQALRQRGHDVTVATTGREGLDAASEGFDVIIADLGLPDLAGLEVIRRIRGSSQVPVVVLSGRPELEAVVKALDAGADDFVHKPFKLVDLEARLRAAQRRPNLAAPRHAVTAGERTIDLERRTIEGGPAPVRLTPTEWKVLTTLATAQGRAVTYATLGRAVWGDTAYVQARESLRVHVAALRAKLGEGCISTESGIGYRWVVGEPSEGSPPVSGAVSETARTDASLEAPLHAPAAPPTDLAADPQADRVLRHELNNAVATLSVITGMLDPTVELSEAARAEAQARLASGVERLRGVARDVSRRLGGA